MTQSKTSSTPAGASKPAQTAGNAPEPWMRKAMEEIACGRADMEPLEFRKCGADIITKHYASRVAASSQEAAALDILQNLLAVIHRDGGHYVSEHGLEKAGKDAEIIVLSMLHAEPAPSPATKETPPKCPQCGSEVREMCSFDCFRNDVDSHEWHRTETRDKMVARLGPVVWEARERWDTLSKNDQLSADADFGEWVAGFVWTELEKDAGAKSVVAAPQLEKENDNATK